MQELSNRSSLLQWLIITRAWPKTSVANLSPRVGSWLLSFSCLYSLVYNLTYHLYPMLYTYGVDPMCPDLDNLFSYCFCCRALRKLPQIYRTTIWFVCRSFYIFFSNFNSLTRPCKIHVTLARASRPANNEKAPMFFAPHLKYSTPQLIILPTATPCPPLSVPEWTNDRTNEWMNERMNESTREEERGAIKASWIHQGGERITCKYRPRHYPSRMFIVAPASTEDANLICHSSWHGLCRLGVGGGGGGGGARLYYSLL